MTNLNNETTIRNISELAQCVAETRCTPLTGKKILISDVYVAFMAATKGQISDITFDAFKSILVEGNRLGYCNLTRLDLVSCWHDDDNTMSKINYSETDCGQFHCVKL